MLNLTFDGVSLTDEANGIMAQYPEDLGAPTVRGDDIVVPFRHGAAPTRKYYAPRVVTINGFIWGDNRAQLWGRIDAFKRVFDITKGPRKLQVDWPDGTKRYLWAEARNSLGIVGTHKTFTPFSVEFHAADPFWRDDSAAQEAAYYLDTQPPKLLGDPTLLLADFDSTYDLAVAGFLNDVPLPNTGNMAIEDALLKITLGYATDALTFINYTSNTLIQIGGVALAAGATVEIDCRRWRATYTTATDHLDITDKMVTRPGQRAPFVIAPGDNICTLQLGNVGAPGPFFATLALTYAAAYL